MRDSEARRDKRRAPGKRPRGRYTACPGCGAAFRIRKTAARLSTIEKHQRAARYRLAKAMLD